MILQMEELQRTMLPENGIIGAYTSGVATMAIVSLGCFTPLPML